MDHDYVGRNDIWCYHIACDYIGHEYAGSYYVGLSNTVAATGKDVGMYHGSAEKETETGCGHVCERV